MKKNILIIVSLILCVAFNMSAQNKVCSIKDSVCSVKVKLELLIIPQNSDENKSDVGTSADVITSTSKPNPVGVNNKPLEKEKVLSQKKATVSDSKSEGNNKKPSKESKEKPQKDTKTAKNKAIGKKVKEKGAKKQESIQEEPNFDDKEQPATNNNTIKKEEKTSTTLKFSKKAKLSNIDIQKNIVSARGTLQGVIYAIDTLQQELDKYKIYQFLGTESDSIFHAGYIQFADNQIPYYAKAFYDYITDVHNMYALFNLGNVRGMTFGDIETIKDIEEKYAKTIVSLCIDFKYSFFYNHLTQEQKGFIDKLTDYAKEYKEISRINNE